MSLQGHSCRGETGGGRGEGGVGEGRGGRGGRGTVRMTGGMCNDHQ